MNKEELRQYILELTLDEMSVATAVAAARKARLAKVGSNLLKKGYKVRKGVFYKAATI